MAEKNNCMGGRGLYSVDVLVANQAAVRLRISRLLAYIVIVSSCPSPRLLTHAGQLDLRLSSDNEMVFLPILFFNPFIMRRSEFCRCSQLHSISVAVRSICAAYFGMEHKNHVHAVCGARRRQNMALYRSSRALPKRRQDVDRMYSPRGINGNWFRNGIARLWSLPCTDYRAQAAMHPHIASDR